MKVNFVLEITAFYRWLKSRHLSNNAQLLWFHLFCYWNEAGFPDWLQVDTLRMMGMVQMKSKNTLIRARDELVNAGLLVVAKGKHKAPNKYQFILFSGTNGCGSDYEPLTGTQTGSKTGSQTGCETGRLFKLNQTKPNLEKEKTAYGEFGNVLLTLDEVEKLQGEYPDWQEWIRRLDTGKEMKGYQYTNDYAALLNWIEKEEREKTEQAFQELMAELQ
ncbi:hypothetical protein [Acetobacterium wieringae]|uniref:hypothetical protein n=1 Tax=Acetobacterium wieringae TaxID=52694 RepID=UPI003158CC9E